MGAVRNPSCPVGAELDAPYSWHVPQQPVPAIGQDEGYRYFRVPLDEVDDRALLVKQPVLMLA
jgi:hypothetical protein